MTAIYTQVSRTHKLVQVYKLVRHKTQQYTNWMHIMKIALLVLGVFAFGLIYIIFVNKASTSGYFHKIESNKLDAIMFDYNLIKLDVLEAEKELRNDVDLSIAHQNPIEVLTQVVTISPKEIAKN